MFLKKLIIDNFACPIAQQAFADTSFILQKQYFQ